MYFDGQDFPAKSAVGWVAAKDLRVFDVKNSNTLVPHVRSVRKFLKTRVAERRPEEEESNELDESVEDGMSKGIRLTCWFVNFHHQMLKTNLLHHHRHKLTKHGHQKFI